MNAEATVTNQIHVFRVSTEEDASAGAKAESAGEVASADVGTNLGQRAPASTVASAEHNASAVIMVGPPLVLYHEELL